jgi:hypothetical protein
MAGMNLEARGLYIPRPLTSSRFTPHSSTHILSLQRHRESSAIFDEPPPGTPRRLSLFPPEQFIQAQSIFRSGSQSPSAAMNSGSPSRHPSDTEEEDSPLQQSTHTSHPLMADSYPEDITSEAEEEAAG